MSYPHGRKKAKKPDVGSVEQPADSDGSLGRYSYVPMPLNAEGKGPEMEPKKVVETLHEIVDCYDGFITVAEAYTAERAQELVDKLNRPDFIQDVMDFHTKFQVGYDGPARLLPNRLHANRANFMQEELDEHITEQNAVGTRRVPKKAIEMQFDALIDLMYVVLGTADLQGLLRFFAAGWNRVHRANMAKVRANPEGDSRSHRDAAFDVVKPAGWTAPNHMDLIEYGMSLPLVSDPLAEKE